MTVGELSTSPRALPAPRWRDRAAVAFVAVATLVSVAALLDPLEGGVLIAVLALPVFAAGRGRWAANGGCCWPGWRPLHWRWPSWS
jgi:hypothetical protein